MTEHQKIMQDLFDKKLGLTTSQVLAIADFILEDRKRIIKPLTEYRKTFVSNKAWEFAVEERQVYEAIDQALKNAGI